VDMNQPFEMSVPSTRKTEVRLKCWATRTSTKRKKVSQLARSPSQFITVYALHYMAYEKFTRFPMRNFRIPSKCGWDLRFSDVLRYVIWHKNYTA